MLMHVFGGWNVYSTGLDIHAFGTQDYSDAAGVHLDNWQVCYFKLYLVKWEKQREGDFRASFIALQPVLFARH
jgi:hypothetical protein